MSKKFATLIALAIPIVLLFGCESSQQKEPKTAAEILIKPFTNPVLLRLREIPSLGWSQTIIQSGFNTPGYNIVFHGTGSIQQTGSKFVLDLASFKVSYNNKILTSDVPLMTVRLIADELGSVEEAEINYAGFRKLGVTMPSREEIQDGIASSKSTLSLPYPVAPVLMGDEVYSSKQLGNSFLNKDYPGLPSDGEIIENSLSARAVGMSNQNGREALVVLTNGNIVVQRDSDKVTATVNERSLIDTKNSLENTETTITIFGTVDGNPVSGEIVSKINLWNN